LNSLTAALTLSRPDHLRALRELSVDTNSATYLYVEDDRFSREVMQLVMEAEVRPLHFEMFEDSTDFMNRLIKLAYIPDVIMLDIHMKPYTGLELLKFIRADHTYDHCRVIALTARVMHEELDMLKTKGFDAVIAKPIPFELMPQLFDQILKGEAIWHI
jgi:CheY-like chemotaxis protein